MAKKTIKEIAPDELTAVIQQELIQYSDNVTDKVYKAGKKRIKELEELTIATAPFRRSDVRLTHFRQSIASKSEKDRIGRSSHLWYVKAPNYRLTHLLVHGHATRNGGRTKPNPFLANACAKVFPEYEKDVEEAVKDG